MSMSLISERISHVIAESAIPSTPCQLCQRKGIPILPLRKALVPDLRPAYRAPLVGGSRVETRLGFRTLRMGFLYMLLDRKLWHAYEVTEHGHLRRFNPLEPSPGPPVPLPERCMGENHDIPSAFLTVDVDTYSTAWIAFASDPWPLSVLNAYRNAEAPTERFVELDLTQVRDTPGTLGAPMTPGNLWIDKHVFEYAEQLPGAFDSAHGFQSRFLRRTATNGYIVNAIAEHGLAQGVLTLALDDTVGLIQEYNHQRLNWVARRQQWREEPERAYQLQTSQILQTLRATHREWAEQDTAQTFEPQTGDGPTQFVSPQVERQRLIDGKVKESNNRLEERYHEPMRAAFQAEYDRQEAEFQRYIDLNTQAYVAMFDTPMFKRIEQYDYDGRNRDSGAGYCNTMALCVAGGITEALNVSGDQSQPAPDSSEALWMKWLKNPNSPPYRAMLLRDELLLASLLPSFSDHESLDWNDSAKLYTALSQTIASDDMGLRLRRSLKQSIAETQGAINAASQRLRPLLSPRIQRAVMHLNCASQWLYNGVQLVEVQVKMKVGEYYALQSAHLRELQQKANAAIAKARERIHRDLTKVDVLAEQNIRKVQPIIQNGLLSLAVMDPRVANLLIDVSIWVEGSAEEVRSRLLSEARAGVDGLSHAAHVGVVDLSVAVGTLDANARKVLQGLRISSQQASQLVRTGFTGLRGVAGSWELLLALGSLYLINDSLEKNLKKAEAVIGDKSREAVLALHGSRLAMLGGGIEIVGLVIREGASRIGTSGYLTSSGQANAGRAAAFGVHLVRVGALIGAVAGICDAAQMGLATKRTFLSGDDAAAIRYTLSTAFYSGSAYAAVFAVSQAALLGPLGFAIGFAIAAYSFAKWAERAESTPLEAWTRRCVFGRADENPVIHWNTFNQADIAFGELNAASLGVFSQAEFRQEVLDPVTLSKTGSIEALARPTLLKFRIILPQFDEHTSGYQWTLVIHRHGDGRAPNYETGEIVSCGESYPFAHSKTALTKSRIASAATPRGHDYKPEKNTLTQINGSGVKDGRVENHYIEFNGSIELTKSFSKHSIEAATLSVAYWPDRTFPDGYAEIILQVSNKL
jgi:hypothetical protein